MEAVSDETMLRIRVLLSMQRALLNMVTPALRVVTVQWDKRSIAARMCYDAPVGDDEAEWASEIEAEMCADFPDHDVSVKPEYFAADVPLSEWPSNGASVYRRRERWDAMS